MTKDKLWSATLALTMAAWLSAPGFRFVSSLILLSHLPFLIWGISSIRSGFFCPVLYKKKPGGRDVALTFDDGPDPRTTPEVLDILKRYDMKATFFVVGNRARRYPDLLRRIFVEGHTVGCHDLTHRYTENFRFVKKMTAQIGEAREIVRSITGRTPLLYRPPVGLTNPHLPAALRKLKMTCIGWSRSAHDAGNGRRNPINKIGTLAGEGQIVLLHDCLPEHNLRTDILKKAFLENLELLLKDIAEKKLYARTIDDFFNIRAYD